MTIKVILQSRNGEVFCAEADEPVRDVIARLSDKRIGALPVLEDGAVAGIFSERDVLRCLHQHGPAMLDAPVRDFMTSPAVTVAPNTDILEALSLMTRRRIRHLPVMDGGTLLGFVSIGDLVKHRIDRIESEAEAMRAYIQTA